MGNGGMNQKKAIIKHEVSMGNETSITAVGVLTVLFGLTYYTMQQLGIPTTYFDEMPAELQIGVQGLATMGLSWFVKASTV